MSRGMDETYVELISISECPEKFIPQEKNRENGSEELMTELERALDSANHSTQRGLNIDSGAGANAGSRADMIHVTTNPLSELVWSPHKGLSLKCADCSSTEKKSSLLGSIEPGNIIISLPQSINAGDNNNNGTVAEGNLSSMQLPPISDSEISNRVTAVSPPRCTVGIMPVPGYQLRNHEQNRRPCGDTEDLSRTMRVPLIDVNPIEDDKSAEEGMVIFSPGDIHTNVDDVRAMTDSVTTLPNKFLIPGTEIGLSANSLLFNQEASKRDLAGVEHGRGNFNKGKSSDHIEESEDVSSGDKVAESDSVNEEDRRNKMIEGMPCCQFPPGSKLVAEGGGACAEVDTIVISQLEDESKDQPSLSQGFLSKSNNASLVEVSPNNSWGRIKQKKYKEKLLLDREVNCNVSNEADDGHESVESSNSGGTILTGKRDWSFEWQQEVIGIKKIKKQSHESHCSASFLKQGSSFINWVSNMVNGNSKIDVNEVPLLAVTAEPSHPRHGNSDPLILSHDKSQDPGCRSMGFQNIFRAMYCPSSRTLDEKSASLGHQGTKGLKELDLANSRTHISSEEDNVKLCKLIPISNQSFNKSASQVGECPLIQPINASANAAAIQEIPASDIGKNRHSFNIACCFEKGGVYTSNFEFGSRSEGKGAKQFHSVDSNKYSNSVTNRSAPPSESLWITRLFPNVSPPMLNLGHCNQVMCADIARITNCNKYLPHSQTGVVSVKDQNNLLNVCEPSIDEQKDAVSREVQNYSGFLTVSRGSERKMIHSDRKFKSKLSPILPSQRFKKSEAMASVFARRLDALKHILLSKVKDNPTQAAATCFFCGIRGHTIRDCSELLGSDLEDILQNINVYDGGEESSCVCIHCFQTTHWAISCPYAYSRKKSHLVGNASLADNENCDTMQQNQKNYAVTNCGGRNLMQSEKMDNQSQLISTHTTFHGENSRVGTELIFRANVNHLIHKERVSDSNAVKKDLPRDDFGIEMAEKKTSREFILNGKQNASNSGENESKENQTSPFCSFVSRQLTSAPRGIFKMINRLRLSRTDIFKWRKSPISHFCLEGFFLRVRLGKWEEELGGTGYHVACISGGFGESSCGSSKDPLFVTIGGLKCLVDCCYVSNHDFVEEELMAWLCASLRGDGKLPSEEELNLKLKERNKYGF